MKKKFCFNCLDYILLAVLAALVIFVFYRISEGLNYKWRWDILLKYIIRIEKDTGRPVAGLILQGFAVTIKLGIWSTVAALFIGIVMGILRSGKGLASRLAGIFYVQLIRNIPPIVLIFIFYYFLGSFIIEITGIEKLVYNSPESVKKVIGFLFINPVRFPAFATAVIAMGIYEGAYITEIVKAGISSVGRGQWEAGRALGMSRRKILKYIVLPQAIRFILPPLAGQFISSIKDSAIVSVISVQELTFQGLEIMAATYLTFEIWLLITFLYFILTFSCSIIFEKYFQGTRRARSV